MERPWVVRAGVRWMAGGVYTNGDRPDRTEPRGRRHVSDDKLLDSLVSDTVRVRYRPRNVSPSVPDAALRQVRPFFGAAADLFCSRRLYHRSTSDGFFAMPCTDGVAVTATKTYKDRLGDDRITVVHEYHEPTNTIVYSGPALPSSESVSSPS